MHIPNIASKRLFCILFIFLHHLRSGDNTLEALQSAIEEVDAMPGDGKFVFLLSDANLRRYGISGTTVSPCLAVLHSNDVIMCTQFSQVLTSKPNVAAFAVFIGSQFAVIKSRYDLILALQV